MTSRAVTLSTGRRTREPAASSALGGRMVVRQEQPDPRTALQMLSSRPVRQRHASLGAMPDFSQRLVARSRRVPANRRIVRAAPAIVRRQWRARSVNRRTATAGDGLRTQATRDSHRRQRRTRRTLTASRPFDANSSACRSAQGSRSGQLVSAFRWETVAVGTHEASSVWVANAPAIRKPGR
jgi:hypothetical protein